MNKAKFSIIPIKRIDVFQEITNRIETLIARSNLQPGDRLPSERDLAEQLGVSRTSVRQALKVLEASQRLESRIGSGTYVASPVTRDPVGLSALLPDKIDTGFLRKLIAARCCIERAVFKECCERVDRQGLESLQALLDDNVHDFVHGENNEGGLDLSFESKVAELAGNPILFRMQEEIHQLWVLAWSKYGSYPESKIVLHQEHLAILDALEKRDCPRLLDLVEQHVDKDLD
jgi:GntR family transcriptional repressor for pyruvate dehydrogenase complex